MKIRLEHNDSTLSFWCPGCQCSHVVYIKAGHGHQWDWNGSHDKPTISPSVLNQWGNKVNPDWKEPAEPAPAGGWSGVCHLYLREGVIQFLSDCTHELVGKTVPLEDRYT